MDFGEYLRRLQARTVYTDYIAREQRISEGCGRGSYYDGRTIPEGERLEILSGQLITTPAETSTVLGSPVANCPGYVPPTPPPTLPSTILVDLTGKDFNVPATEFASSFTILPTSTIRVQFINSESANVGNVNYLQFNAFGAIPTFTPSDTITIENPTFIPFTNIQIFPGPNSWAYATDNFGLTTSSIISFNSANFYSTIFFVMNSPT